MKAKKMALARTPRPNPYANGHGRAGLDSGPVKSVAETAMSRFNGGAEEAQL